MNAMEHGNRYGATGRVEVLLGDGAVRVPRHRSRRSDAAGAARTPDIEAKLAGRQSPRGWGRMLIEKLVDEARVTRRSARSSW